MKEKKNKNCTIEIRFGHFFESGIEAIGGLVLIGLGVKILLQHLIV